MSLQTVEAPSLPSSALLEYASNAAASGPKRLAGGDILACGFGITAAVWIGAYVCRLPFVQASGEVTIGTMIAMMVVGGFLAARYSQKGFWCAIGAGVVSGMLDLLIVGALFHDNKDRLHSSVVPVSTLWVVGSILLSAVACSIGGAVGAFLPSRKRERILWTHIFAMILTLTTALLIGAGGLVVAFKAGLAVPDWPQSYGYNMFLFPLSVMQAQDGRFYEHAHRLIASLVGFTSLVLAIHIVFADRRGWVKALAWVIGFGVLIQAVLGGTRVTESSTTLAIAHGVFAQMVFAAMAGLAVMTSRAFYELPKFPRPYASTDRAFSIALVVSLCLQLVLGATVRHLNKEVMMHITMAAMVTFLVLACGFRAWGLHGTIKPLVRSGLAVLGIVLMQLTLGILALVFWTGNAKDAELKSALLTTAHQVNGALLLAVSTVLMVWTYRLIVPGADQGAVDA